jgi:endonuclease/exonuclease/phosphatase family metal-dependent hydrolase
MLHDIDTRSGEADFMGAGSAAGRDLLMIASYNIHGCVGVDMRYDVERVARVILELRCDTVGLQEVDSRPSASVRRSGVVALGDGAGPRRDPAARCRAAVFRTTAAGDATAADGGLIMADGAALGQGAMGVYGALGANRSAGRYNMASCYTSGLEALQLKQLAEATGMRPVVATPAGSSQFHFSNANALLTRREVGAVRVHDLSYKSREPRSALDVELHAGGRAMRVIVTHLGLRPGERRYQVRKLLTVLREIPPEQGVVVLGDINEWLPIGRPLRWLHGLLGKPPWQRSFPVWAPVFALDRVWTRPLGALLGFTVHRSVESRRASDHYPVKAVVAPDVTRPHPQPR